MQKILNGLDAQIALAPRGSAPGICTPHSPAAKIVLLRDAEGSTGGQNKFPLFPFRNGKGSSPKVLLLLLKQILANIEFKQIN